MAPSGSQNFSVVYYGFNRPLTFIYTATNLRTGVTYQFKVASMNFNGQSLTTSAIFEFNACLVPSSFAAPSYIGSTASSITIAWQKPTDDGGCPLIGFAVFRDNGLGGAPTIEVNSINDAAVRSQPTLRRLVVTSFPVGLAGSSFVFKITAFNREGETDSAYASYLLAGVPNTPTLAPTLVQAETNITTITATLPLISDSDNGYSPILSYQLDIDDGQGGSYSPVGGYDPYSLKTSYSITHGIMRGRTYRLRYRVANSIGAS
jgi:hypothetical protein